MMKINKYLRGSQLCQLLILSGLVMWFAACVPASQSGTSSGTSVRGTSVRGTTNAVFADRIFTDQIQTVSLFKPDEILYDAVVPIMQNVPVFLTFDRLELAADQSFGELNAKIIHCNADWRPSQLYSMDYLDEYNEFPITNEEFSYNTKVPFAHYRWELPRVKLPGNYILMVYEDNKDDQPLFTKRLMVYSPQVNISASILRSANVQQRDTHQQLEFVVDYGGFEIPNPYNDVYVVVRQNQQWFNAITGLKPTFVREDVRELEYQRLDLNNSFWAANEFRFFDLRTSNALGQNVAEIDQDELPMEAFLLPDRSRAREVYSQYNDLNGGFIIENLENRGEALTSDYLLTHFFLDAEQEINGDVYVIGAFNNRTLTEEVKMEFDQLQKGYKLDVLLKQGFYNYLYYVDNPSGQNPYQFDGSYFEAENLYEILVYARPIGARADVLIGYTSLVSNPR